MLKFTRKQTKLEQEIESIFEEMEELDLCSEEYELALSRLETLYELQGMAGKTSVSKDTMLIVGGNLLGILLILKYEDMNVLTSKALGFVIKGRV